MENQATKKQFSDMTTSEKAISVVKKVSAVLVLLLGLIAALLLAILTMTGIASATHSAAFAYIMQFIVFVAVFGAACFFGLCLFGVKKKKSLISSSITTAVLYLGLLTFVLCIFFLPVANNAKYTMDTTKTWKLETGSEIAYIEYKENVTKEYPVIYLHGGAGCPVNAKESFVDLLVQNGYDVYQYDQFGAGNSSRAEDPNEYTVDRHIEDLEQIRLTIGADKLILIGHSWGCTLAANYMAKYPDNVENAIFISPGPIWNGDKDIPSRTSAGQKDVVSAMTKNFRYLMAQAFASLGPSDGLYYLMSEEKLDKLFMNFHDDLNMKPGSGEYYNSIGAGYGFWANLLTGKDTQKMPCPYEELKRSTSRNLLIRGQFDYISWEATRKYRDAIPNTTMITIDGMGHSVQAQYEASLGADIISFLLNGTTISTPYTQAEYPW